MDEKVLIEVIEIRYNFELEVVTHVENSSRMYKN